MAETIDETISKLFYKAYSNDELFEYLIGKGEYFITLKETAGFRVNDIVLMQRGISFFAMNNPDINIGEYLNNKLIDFINSNDTLKVTTALDFIFYYAGYAQKLQYSFKIDVENILPLLKERVAQLKHQLLKAHQENKWNTIETNCYVFEMSTGQKIL